MDRDDLRRAIHMLKGKVGLGGADNVVIDPLTGDVTFREEWVGNLFDE